MKVSIVGAGRTRNGIGEYIGKYFNQEGGQVTSVLGTTEKTSLQASTVLRSYGIEARAYVDFDDMVQTEKPDAVVIASPSTTHYGYLLKSLHSRLHIFCEKPLVWGETTDLSKKIEDIFAKARQWGLIIAMNSQWPFAIGPYEKICEGLPIEEANTFFIKMSPPFPGREMIPESVPHALSLLYCLLGDGEMENQVEYL